MPDSDATPHPGPRPTPPTPEQCCGTACDPCIWTYHQRAMERWEERAARWTTAGDRLDSED